MEREIKKEEIPILNIDENVEAPPARELVEMESSFDNIENDLKEVIASGDALRKTFLELTEMRHVLHKTQQFFDQVREYIYASTSDRTSHHRVIFPHSVIRVPHVIKCIIKCWTCVRGNEMNHATGC